MSSNSKIENAKLNYATSLFVSWFFLNPDTLDSSWCRCNVQVAGGLSEQHDQEVDRASRRLDQRHGEGGDPQDSGEPLLGRRGQWQRELGL